MTAPKIFGREPAAWVGLIEAVLMTLLAFGIGVGQDTFGPIMGVVVAAFGVFTAWATRDTMLGVIVGLAKSVMVLAAVYGLTLSDEQTGALIAVVTMVVSFYQRTQTSPVADPVDPSPQQVVPVAPPVGVSVPTDGREYSVSFTTSAAEAAQFAQRWLPAWTGNDPQRLAAAAARPGGRGCAGRAG